MNVFVVFCMIFAYSHNLLQHARKGRDEEKGRMKGTRQKETERERERREDRQGREEKTRYFPRDREALDHIRQRSKERKKKGQEARMRRIVRACVPLCCSCFGSMSRYVPLSPSLVRPSHSSSLP